VAAVLALLLNLRLLLQPVEVSSLAHAKANDILFDFSNSASEKNQGDLNFYPVEVNYGDAVQEFHIGLGSMAVPGNIGGSFHVHKQLGRLPFKIVAEPAIHYAKLV